MNTSPARSKPSLIALVIVIGSLAWAVVLALDIVPDLVNESSGPGQPGVWGEFARYGLLAALGVAVFVVPFACPWPDGLESVAAKLGFEHKATEPVLAAPASGYRVPGVHWAAGATAMAGAAGAVVVFVLALVLARSLVPEPEAHGRSNKP